MINTTKIKTILILSATVITFILGFSYTSIFLNEKLLLIKSFEQYSKSAIIINDNKELLYFMTRLHDQGIDQISYYSQKDLISSVPVQGKQKLQTITLSRNIEFSNTPSDHTFRYSIDISTPILATITMLLFVIIISWVTYKFIIAELKRRTEIEQKDQNQKRLFSLATQLAHDIRSPLAALDMVMKDTAELPEDKRLLIRHSVNRINDIANDLLNKNRPNSDTVQTAITEVTTSEMLATHLSSIITEKRFQYKSKSQIEINCDLTKSYGLFSSINIISFRRVISNIINNAVESIDTNGEVRINLLTENNQNIITIWNNGKLIPENILKSLGTKGITDKKCGNGLGVYHAIEKVRSWGGDITYSSSKNEGTNVTIKLPQSTRPQWFITELKIKPTSKIAIIDDDSSIHQVWKGRFASSNISDNIDIISFFSPEEVIAQKDSLDDVTLFLVDYEFINSQSNGLALIKNLNIHSRSILVTSRFDESHIQTDALKLTGMIPKNSAIYLPIRLDSTSEPQNKKVILIDDDELMRLTWGVSIKDSDFESFATADEFYEIAESLDRSSDIFIDVHIGDINGLDVAAKLAQMGFTNLYLTTGYDKENISAPSYIKEVYSKKKPDWVK